MTNQQTYKFFSLVLLLIAITLITTPVQATNGAELLKLAQERYNFQDQSYVMKLKNIVRTKNDTDTAHLKVYIYQGGKRQVITFTAPQRLTDQKYLVIESNTWMYQQGLRRPIRISAQQKLFGDAGVGETVGIDYYQDYQIKTTTHNNSHYILELIAKDNKTSYQQAKVWITDDGYFDKIILKAVNGTPLKKINYQNYQTINNHEVADLVISNLLHKTNQTTELKYINIQEKNLPVKAFKPLMMGKFELLLQQAGD